MNHAIMTIPRRISRDCKISRAMFDEYLKMEFSHKNYTFADA